MPRSKEEVVGVCLTEHSLVEAGRRCLPFQLTGAQNRALEEVLTDIGRPSPMMRLLQVGPPFSSQPLPPVFDKVFKTVGLTRTIKL